MFAEVCLKSRMLRYLRVDMEVPVDKAEASVFQDEEKVDSDGG